MPRMTARPLPGEPAIGTLLRSAVVTAAGTTTVDVDMAGASIAGVPCTGAPPAVGTPVPVLISGTRMLALTGGGAGGGGGAPGPPGPGVPAGGAKSQILRKGSTADYDTYWYTPPWSVPVQRSSVLAPAGVLAPGADALVDLQSAWPTAMLLHVGSHLPARVRGYVSDAARTADRARPVTEHPDTITSGLLFEFVTTTLLTGFDLGPGLVIWTTDGSSRLPLTVENTGAGSANLSPGFLYVPTTEVPTS
jgi:hypothetical protein